MESQLSKWSVRVRLAGLPCVGQVLVSPSRVSRDPAVINQLWPISSSGAHLGAEPAGPHRWIIDVHFLPLVWYPPLRDSSVFLWTACHLLSPCVQCCLVPREAVHSPGPGYPAVEPPSRRSLFLSFLCFFPPVGTLGLFPPCTQ